MKALIILYIFTSIFSCEYESKPLPSIGTSQNVFTTDNGTQKEDKILDAVRKLPEVIEREKYLDSLTNHKGHVALMVESKPSKLQPYYWIKVGYDNELRFETYFNFYIYNVGNGNLEIKYYDVVIGKAITLKEWRKRKKN
jgi:hypothetical protein